ncbi:MAG TPA: class I SAM-dependent methyltransferase [Gemmatimonadaceae bacterium]|nr:class I SAM-dependent methyltransferase [Gemmatimonadaceae bacterium]
MTAPKIFTPEYYSRMREMENSSWWNEGMRDIAGMLLARSRLPAEGLMVDVGTGPGQTMSWFLASHAGWHSAGFDVSLDALSLARQIELPVCQATALRLPLPDSSAQLVISLDVLQHLPLDGGDSQALGEFARILSPEGVLLVRTNAQSIPRTQDDKEFSFRKYEPRILRRRLLDARFHIEVLGRCNAVPGLAEIPREVRAARHQNHEYHGILVNPTRNPPLVHSMLRSWLRFEGRAMIAGVPLPLGRTIFALCRVRK